MIIYGKKGGHVESSGLLERVHQSLNGAGLSHVDFKWRGSPNNAVFLSKKKGSALDGREGVDFLLCQFGRQRNVLSTARESVAES
ncbi:MAG: hypothetical protein ACLU9T_04140 [Blautia faecis]